MALTLGSGPFSKQRSSADANYEIEGPEHLLLFEDYPRRMRALLGGETVVDSERGKLLFESNIPPVLYLPEDDLAPGVTESTSHATHCPFKGDAAYWSLRVGDRVAENAVWGYPEPGERARWLKGYVSIYWGAVDQWLQEDEPLVGHLRDPYHRVDVRSSTRRVRVTAGGELLAETTQPKLLFETSLPTRYYIPRADVPAERLSATEKVTHCPYKGEASYWSASVGDELLEDVAWGYAEPLPEAAAVRDHLSFTGEGVEIEVEHPATVSVASSAA